MKEMFLCVLSFLVMAAAAEAKDLEMKKKTGELEVKLTLKQNPPVVGNNDMTVEIRDPAGKPVTDAKVVVNYSMPAMPGMPPMNYKTDAALSGEQYHGRINLSMAGAWNIEVRITRAGKTSSAKFNVDAK